MRAVILDGSSADDGAASSARGQIEARLKESGWEFDSETLRDVLIAPCLACFTCWLKTPGKCVLDDDGQRVTEEMARADLLVLISPITFGGYSSDLKKAWDRILPALLPFFKRSDGETHHPTRSGRSWDLLSIGTIATPNQEREQLFKDLLYRDSLNAHSLRYDSITLHRGESPASMRMKLDAALGKLGVSK